MADSPEASAEPSNSSARGTGEETSVPRRKYVLHMFDMIHFSKHFQQHLKFNMYSSIFLERNPTTSPAPRHPSNNTDTLVDSEMMVDDTRGDDMESTVVRLLNIIMFIVSGVCAIISTVYRPLYYHIK